MRIRVCLAAVFFLLGALALAQSPVAGLHNAPQYASQRDLIRGQISSDGAVGGGLTVELVAFGRADSTTAMCEGDGSFEFYGIAQGQYQLRVTAGGQTVHEEPVFVTGGYQNLSVHVKSPPTSSGSAQSTVSIRQLQHKVPGAAQKEFEKGTSAANKRDQSAALSHFQKATNIDPEFADAYNSLGVTYMALGQLQPAADQFQKAIDLVPDHNSAVANLSVALCKLQHFHEAGQVARQALKSNPGLLKIRYVLGLSLMAEERNKVEALDNLERAAPEIPYAHLLAAKLLAEEGRREDAAKHLDTYLRAVPPSDSQRQKAETWLAQLRD